MFHTPMGCVGSSTFNLYLDTDDPTLSDIKVPMLLHGVQALHPEEIIDTVRSSSRGPSLPMSNDAQEMQRLLVSTDYSVAELANQLGYSPDGFIRIFKRAVGATPGQYRRAHWLTEARRRIRGGASLADAAFAATFADQSHLGRHFLRAYGATPGGYRAAFQPGRRSISFQTSVDG
ncbi:MAG: AraC family transcriptional regulator [Shinella sp.]|uniref:helix-turn-helix domain-containing protein n=1 Tax=Shinella sp. TaxID=1870904 RepID=UPI003C785FAE